MYLISLPKKLRNMIYDIIIYFFFVLFCEIKISNICCIGGVEGRWWSDLDQNIRFWENELESIAWVKHQYCQFGYNSIRTAGWVVAGPVTTVAFTCTSCKHA